MSDPRIRFTSPNPIPVPRFPNLQKWIIRGGICAVCAIIVYGIVAWVRRIRKPERPPVSNSDMLGEPSAPNSNMFEGPSVPHSDMLAGPSVPNSNCAIRNRKSTQAIIDESSYVSEYNRESPVSNSDMLVEPSVLNSDMQAGPSVPHSDMLAGPSVPNSNCAIRNRKSTQAIIDESSYVSEYNRESPVSNSDMLVEPSVLNSDMQAGPSVPHSDMLAGPSVPNSNGAIRNRKSTQAIIDESSYVSEYNRESPVSNSDMLVGPSVLNSDMRAGPSVPHSDMLAGPSVPNSNGAIRNRKSTQAIIDESSHVSEYNRGSPVPNSDMPITPSVPNYDMRAGPSASNSKGASGGRKVTKKVIDESSSVMDDLSCEDNNKNNNNKDNENNKDDKDNQEKKDNRDNDDFRYRIREVSNHLQDRFTRFFRFSGAIQRVSEGTGLDRNVVVTAGPSELQDQTSHRGHEYHAAHIVRAVINPNLQSICLHCYNELKNFLGHTQNVIREANNWFGIGGDIDRFQSEMLAELAKIDFSKTLSEEDAKIIEKLKNDFIALLDKRINQTNIGTNIKLQLIKLKENVQKLSIELLFEKGRNGYSGERMEPYRNAGVGKKQGKGKGPLCEQCAKRRDDEDINDDDEDINDDDDSIDDIAKKFKKM